MDRLEDVLTVERPPPTARDERMSHGRSCRWRRRQASRNEVLSRKGTARLPLAARETRSRTVHVLYTCAYEMVSDSNVVNGVSFVSFVSFVSV